MIARIVSLDLLSLQLTFLPFEPPSLLFLPSPPPHHHHLLISTSIGFGSSRAGTSKAHGEPLGAKLTQEVKTTFGFDPEATFVVTDAVRARYAALVERGAQQEQQWQTLLDNYAAQHPDLVAKPNQKSKKKIHLVIFCLFVAPSFIFHFPSMTNLDDFSTYS